MRKEPSGSFFFVRYSLSGWRRRLRKAPGVSPQSCLNSLAKVARSA